MPFRPGDPTLYVPEPKRYDTMQYRRTGRSGIQLPAISLGLWHNFGGVDNFENARAMLRRAFDLGITHFDLANNYGPPYGSAEENFGPIPKQGLLDVLGKEGVGCIVFSPLAQGLLSDRYLQGIPSDSRAARDFFLKRKDIDERKVAMLRDLNTIAQQRGQSLAEMAVAWVLRDPRVTSALVGTSKVQQVDDNVAALKNLSFSPEELRKIDGLLAGKQSAA